MLLKPLMFLGLLLGQTTRPAASSSPLEHVRAELRAERNTVNAGGPVWVEFVIRNTGPETTEVSVPGAELPAGTAATGPMGLPIEHVFSGPGWRALSISDGVRKRLGDSVRRPPVGPVRSVRLAGHSSVGVCLDLGRFYPILRETGQYACVWSPYDGLLKSNWLNIEVTVLQQAVIRTDLGDMTVQLLYDRAPRHVANFLELAGKRFYNGLTFHRVVTGSLIQGGDPQGDGTGGRTDGKTLEPEFNDTPFGSGTVGMALAPGEPGSASCQFFVCLKRIAVLDGKYTAFGHLVGQDSLATLWRIGSVRTDEHDRPVEPVRIDSIVVQPMRTWQEEW